MDSNTSRRYMVHFGSLKFTQEIFIPLKCWSRHVHFSVFATPGHNSSKVNKTTIRFHCITEKNSIDRYLYSEIDYSASPFEIASFHGTCSLWQLIDALKSGIAKKDECDEKENVSISSKDEGVDMEFIENTGIRMRIGSGQWIESNLMIPCSSQISSSSSNYKCINHVWVGMSVTIANILSALATFANYGKITIFDHCWQLSSHSNRQSNQNAYQTNGAMFTFNPPGSHLSSLESKTQQSIIFPNYPFRLFQKQMTLCKRMDWKFELDEKTGNSRLIVDLLGGNQLILFSVCFDERCDCESVG